MSVDCLEGESRDEETWMGTEKKKIYATINHHGLGVEGRGGDALSVHLDTKADGPNNKGGTRGNGGKGLAGDEEDHVYRGD